MRVRAGGCAAAGAIALCEQRCTQVRVYTQRTEFGRKGEAGWTAVAVEADGGGGRGHLHEHCYWDGGGATNVGVVAC